MTGHDWALTDGPAAGPRPWRCRRCGELCAPLGIVPGPTYLCSVFTGGRWMPMVCDEILALRVLES